MLLSQLCLALVKLSYLLINIIDTMHKCIASKAAGPQTGQITVGRIELPKVVDRGEALDKLIKERRCDSQSRGSLYDSKAGKPLQSRGVTLSTSSCTIHIHFDMLK